MPSPTKTKGAYRGKADPRMSLVKWARDNGACHIKVDGVELVFPVSYAPGVSQDASRELSPEDIVRRASGSKEFNQNAPNAITSQHPDDYAEQSDRWASWAPDANRG